MSNKIVAKGTRTNKRGNAQVGAVPTPWKYNQAEPQGPHRMNPHKREDKFFAKQLGITTKRYRKRMRKLRHD